MGALKHFRVVSLLEGTSYLLLLAVAMPLKYLAGFPLATKVTGSLHGVLFMLFLAALYRAMLEAKWPWRRAALAMVACLTPLGAFVFDRSLQREISARAAQENVS